MKRYLSGIGINGIPFDPGTAEFWQNDRSSGWNYEGVANANNLGIDQNNAHVQPDGTYHYHGLPWGLMNNRGWEEGTKSPVIGFAADGFPMLAIYAGGQKLKPSYRLKSGARPGGPGGSYDGTFVEDWEYVKGLGDLDECNGIRTKDGGYVYILTEQYPFILRCFMGTPDASFQKQMGNGSAQGQNRRGHHPKSRSHSSDNTYGRPPHPHHH